MGLAAGSFGCELIAGIDRSKIDGTGGGGGAAGGGGTGGAPECTKAEDCPAPENECEAASCDAGQCGATPVADGTPVATQTPGDCKATQCDGAGMTKVVDDDMDTSDDKNPCTVDSCAGGMAQHDPAAAGTACGAGLQCDGNGACVGCVMPADCPGTDDDCQQRTCDGGVCGTSFTAAGTATSTQTPGDCLENRCDGAGKVVAAALDTDLPDDNKECTDDVCMAGVASHPNTMIGVACTEGGGSLCSGAGTCVQCNVAADCPGMDTECQQRTCNNNVCGTQNTMAGTPVASQQPGDCKVVQCNGLGATETVNQDMDVPDDSNPCTNDLCNAGAPSHTNVTAGTTCGASGVCDNNGACVGCNTAADCPGADTECQTRTCVSNTCGFNYTAAGTAVMMQTPQDCKVNQCDGNGNIVVANANDPIIDGNQCTDDLCNAGVPSNPPVNSGAACNQMGGAVCNGAGACVQCLAAGTCPGMDTECQTRTCLMGTCGTANVQAGTPTSMQTPQDCKVNQCNGNGGIETVNANDPIIDGIQCTSDICTMGTPSNPPAPSGTLCNQMSGTVCDGAGVCVQCVMNSDCVGQTGGACMGNVCQAPTCTDGLKNADETDIDCGGNTCPACTNGKTCMVDNDCTSGGCVGGVCSLINGCDKATATDYGTTPPAITFANGNFSYLPKCMKVTASATTMVTFNGNFGAHPLLGGTVVGGTATPAASGPFVPVTSSGTTKTFTMTQTGTFPYYCVPHATIGMNGVIFVVP